MANLQTEIEIFINRAQQKIGTLGDTIRSDDQNGLDLQYNISLVQELYAAIFILQEEELTENLSYKIISYLSEKADLNVIPIAVFDDTLLVRNVLLPTGGYTTGPQGPAGDAATIEIGTVTTLPAGNSATVTNSGNSSAAIFDFGIPQGDDGADGDTGWSAEYAIITDGQRRVLKVVDWIGGTGTPPTPIDVYLGATGFVADIADAIDIRGAVGATGTDGIDGTDGYNGWSPIWAIVSDGTRRVLQIIDWTGGTGTKPGTGNYIYTGGLTSNISLASDIRGPQGLQGDPFTIDASGPLSDRNLYDDEGTGFTYLAEDTGDVYIKNSPLTGDWGPPISFIGQKGWSPLFMVVEDGERRLIQVSDWVGGEGEKPEDQGYLWPFGFTTIASDATDFRGERGEFFIDASGPLSDRDNYDEELRPFTYYATDNGKIYIKNSDADADWTTGFDFRGERGPEGPVGSQGINAYTVTTAGFTVPAVNSNVNVQVLNDIWMGAQQIVFIESAGYYQVVTFVSSSVVTLKNLGYTGNASPTTVIALGKIVSPGGLQGTDGISSLQFTSYDTGTSYVVGDTMTTGGVIYICHTPTSGSFDSSKWNILAVNTSSYGVGWSGSIMAPTQDAVYDKIELILTQVLLLDGSLPMEGDLDMDFYNIDNIGRLTLGIYGSMSETQGGLAYIIGNSVEADPVLNNTVVKTSNDIGHYIKMVYNMGGSLHAGFTGAIGTTTADNNFKIAGWNEDSFFIMEGMYLDFNPSAPGGKIILKESNNLTFYNTDDDFIFATEAGFRITDYTKVTDLLTIDQSGNVEASGDAVLTDDTKAYYIGDKNTDGSFRLRIDTGSFAIEKRIATVWTAQSFVSTISRVYQFSLTGTASATTGFLTKASDSGLVANPSGKPTTYVYDPGIQNGACDGYTILNSCTITKIRIVIAGAAVSTGTVGTPTLRLQIYKNNYSTRTQLGSDQDITLSATGIGTFNNVSGNAFQTAAVTGLSISVSAGDNIGIEFANQSGTNDGINAVRHLFVVLETQE